MEEESSYECKASVKVYKKYIILVTDQLNAQILVL